MTPIAFWTGFLVLSPAMGIVPDMVRHFAALRLCARACALRRPSRPAAASLALVLACALGAPGGLSAQGAIVGSVEDSTGAPVPEVQIEVLGTRMRLVTSEGGRFRIADLRAGTYQLRARRLGFEPVQFAVQVTSQDTARVAVELHGTVRDLAKVVVTAAPISPRLHDVGFEQRRLYGAVPPSQFVTRTDIERRNPVVLSQMLRTMTGRAQVCANGLVFVDGVRMGTLVETEDAARSDTGTGGRAGPATRIMGGAMSFDATPPPRAKEQLDYIPPLQVAGMEVYVGSAQIPPQYKTAGRSNSTSACVILVWTG